MEQLQTATRSIPGPRPMPVIGRLGNVIQFGLDPLGTLTRLFQRYGSVVALVP